jgi:hypothetical protein
MLGGILNQYALRFQIDLRPDRRQPQIGSDEGPGVEAAGVDNHVFKFRDFPADGVREPTAAVFRQRLVVNNGD